MVKVLDFKNLPPTVFPAFLRFKKPGEGGAARPARAVMKSTRQSKRLPCCYQSIINRSDRALVLWCCGAFSLRSLKFKNANLRTDRFSCTFLLLLRTCHRPFFENVLKIKNKPPTVFRIRAPRERGNPVLQGPRVLGPLKTSRTSRTYAVQICHVPRGFWRPHAFVRGNLAHKKTQPPPSTTIGP